MDTRQTKRNYPILLKIVIRTYEGGKMERNF